MPYLTLFKSTISLGACLGLLCMLLAQSAPLSLSPNPDSPAKSKPTPTSENPMKLQVQKQGIPKALLLRQLQPKRYPKFEAKTQDVRKSLMTALAYINSLNEKPPSLQRLSAFSAETTLEWRLLEERITPEEKGYRSYELMKEAVHELGSLSNYWVTTEKVRRTFRGTAREAQLDQEIMTAKRLKIEAALIELEKFEQLKTDLRTELPY